MVLKLEDYHILFLFFSDIRKVKDAKKYFEKISDDMDNALIRNSNVLRSKPQECEEVTNGLIATRSAFAHNSLDYVYQVSLTTSQ